MLHHLRNREKNTYQWEGDVDVVISDLEEVITNVGAPLQKSAKRVSHAIVMTQSVWVLRAYGILTSCKLSADRRTDYSH